MTRNIDRICDHIMSAALEMRFIPRGLPASTAMSDYMDSLDFAELCLEIEDVLRFRVPDDLIVGETFAAFAARLHAGQNHAKD